MKAVVIVDAWHFARLCWPAPLIFYQESLNAAPHYAEEKSETPFSRAAQRFRQGVLRVCPSGRLGFFLGRRARAHRGFDLGRRLYAGARRGHRSGFQSDAVDRWMDRRSYGDRDHLRRRSLSCGVGDGRFTKFGVFRPYCHSPRCLSAPQCLGKNFGRGRHGRRSEKKGARNLLCISRSTVVWRRRS